MLTVTKETSSSPFVRRSSSSGAPIGALRIFAIASTLQELNPKLKMPNVPLRQDREWDYGTTYKYSVEGEKDGKPFSFGSPPSVCSALRPRWFTMPALGQTYQQRMMTLAHEGTSTKHGKRKIQDVDPDFPTGSSSVSMTNMVSRHWYQRHLASPYQMKFLGRLGNEVVAKFTEQLSLLCDDALHRNLDVIAGSPELNLVLAAAKKDSTNVRYDKAAASCEDDMQRWVADILQRHQIILEHLLANQPTRISTTEPSTYPRAFDVSQVPNAMNLTNRDGISPRTMACEKSTPCTNIAVTLANTPSSFSCGGQTRKALNRKLRTGLFEKLWNYEQKCWIDAADGLRTDKLVKYLWPSCSSSMCDVQASETAQPGFIQTPNTGGCASHFQKETTRKHRGPHGRSVYHSYDISGASSDPDILNPLRPEIEQEYLKILGLDNSPVLQSMADAAMDVHPATADLNQVSLHSPELHA